MLSVPVFIFSLSRLVFYHNHNVLQKVDGEQVWRDQQGLCFRCLGSVPSQQYQSVRVHTFMVIFFTRGFTSAVCEAGWKSLAYYDPHPSPAHRNLGWHSLSVNTMLQTCCRCCDLSPWLHSHSFIHQDVYSRPWLRCYRAVNAIHLFHSLAGVSM